MKHDVHVFVVVRVKCAGIEAESHDEAAKKAMERFHDLYGLFETANFRHLPEGVTDVEFGEEFSHFLVDREDDPEHEWSTWHNAQGDLEPFLVERPLSAEEFRNRIGSDGRVRLAIAVSLDDLHDCGDIDGFNDLVDSRLYGNGVRGCLTDLVYRPLRVENDRVLIEVSAATEELELKEMEEGEEARSQ